MLNNSAKYKLPNYFTSRCSNEFSSDHSMKCGAVTSKEEEEEKKMNRRLSW